MLTRDNGRRALRLLSISMNLIFAQATNIPTVLDALMEYKTSGITFAIALLLFVIGGRLVNSVSKGL